MSRSQLLPDPRGRLGPGPRKGLTSTPWVFFVLIQLSFRVQVVIYHRLLYAYAI